jgi:hypothetical protein
MERHNPDPERKHLSSQTSLPSKIILLEGEIKGICDHQASTTEVTLRTFTCKRRN